MRTGFETHNVLAINVPVVSYERGPEQLARLYKDVIKRISELPGVERVAVGTIVPWRDAGTFGPGFQFTADYSTPATDCSRNCWNARAVARWRRRSPPTVSTPIRI